MAQRSNNRPPPLKFLAAASEGSRCGFIPGRGWVRWSVGRAEEGARTQGETAKSKSRDLQIWRVARAPFRVGSAVIHTSRTTMAACTILQVRRFCMLDSVVFELKFFSNGESRCGRLAILSYTLSFHWSWSITMYRYTLFGLNSHTVRRAGTYFFFVF